MTSILSRDPGSGLPGSGQARTDPGFPVRVLSGFGQGSGENSNSIATVFIMINCAIDETSTENAGEYLFGDPDADLKLPARDEH